MNFSESLFLCPEPPPFSKEGAGGGQYGIRKKVRYKK